MKIIAAVIFILVIIFISFLATMSFLITDDVAPKIFYTVMTIIAIAIFCKVFFGITPEQKIQYHQQQIEKIENEMSMEKEAVWLGGRFMGYRYKLPPEADCKEE